MMTDPEIYEFDLHGIIIYRNLIPTAKVAEMNAIIDRHQKGEFPWSFQFFDIDPCFFDLAAHPKTMGILRTMLGDWFRLDHAYGLQMTRDTITHAGDNLHGGPRQDQGEHQYQWVQGRMYNGLVVVMYALQDVNPGDGGFIAVPGSHKANHPYKPEVTSHLVTNPSLKAGDMLIFTEALVHGTRKWQSPNRRRSLLYKYSPGYSCWAPADAMQKHLPLARTQFQKDLLRMPEVGNRKALPFDTL